MFEMMMSSSGVVSSTLSLVSLIVAAFELIARIRARRAGPDQRPASAVLSRTERRALARAARRTRRNTAPAGKLCSNYTGRTVDCRT